MQSSMSEDGGFSGMGNVLSSMQALNGSNTGSKNQLIRSNQLPSHQARDLKSTEDWKLQKAAQRLQPESGVEDRRGDELAQYQKTKMDHVVLFSPQRDELA